LIHVNDRTSSFLKTHCGTRVEMLRRRPQGVDNDLIRPIRVAARKAPLRDSDLCWLRLSGGVLLLHVQQHTQHSRLIFIHGIVSDVLRATSDRGIASSDVFAGGGPAMASTTAVRLTSGTAGYARAGFVQDSAAISAA
jgi:hypothetical protein